MTLTILWLLVMMLSIKNTIFLMAVSPLRQLTGFVKLLVRQYFMIALVFNFTSVFAISFVIRNDNNNWWRWWKFTMTLPGSSGVRHLVSGYCYVLSFQAFQVSRLKSTRSRLPSFVSAPLSQIRLAIFFLCINNDNDNNFMVFRWEKSYSGTMVSMVR